MPSKWRSVAFLLVERELEVEILYRESFVCLFDAQACGVDPPLSLDAYAALPHVLVSLRGEPFGHVDELLEAVGRRRSVLYTTPHFLAVPFLLHGLRAVAALPRRLAENCADAAGLALFRSRCPPTGMTSAWSGIAGQPPTRPRRGFAQPSRQ